MSDRHPENTEEQIYFLEKQEISINDFEASGLILDIGGGGEGIIGRLKGEQVVAVDPNREELEEAPAGPLKIVMNAENLQFLDSTFAAATSFFTLMYINYTDHEQIFSEVFRVLERGGRFFVWDAELPECLDETKDIVAFHLRVKLPREEIETGYGIKWPEQKLGMHYYHDKAEHAGFIISNQSEMGRIFYVEYRKV